jgi:copper homeostasis protein
MRLSPRNESRRLSFRHRLTDKASGPPISKKQNGFVLEICAESVDYAVAAERANAHRIELCSDLASGGITPSAGLMRAARRHLRLPIHVLIRPRLGNFTYSERELEIMQNDIGMAKQLGMDGIVVGVLNAKSRVDVACMRELVALACPLSVTFHRAFDHCRDWEEALEAVIETGAQRILTSGMQPRAADGISSLARLVKAAQGRITIMPGGGINATNVLKIVHATSVREVHASLLASARCNGQRRLQEMSLESDTCDAKAYEKKVHRLVSLLEGTRAQESQR